MTLRNFATSLRNAMANAWVDAIDGGGAAGHWLGGTDSGSSTYGTELFDCTFTYPGAFGNAGAVNPGEAVAASITGETNAPNTGTAAIMRITTSTPATLYEGDIDTSGADLNLNSTSISATDTVDIDSAEITFPAAA